MNTLNMRGELKNILAEDIEIEMTAVSNVPRISMSTVLSYFFSAIVDLRQESLQECQERSDQSGRHDNKQGRRPYRV